jgi:uncharacterized protein (TIGR02231 family)
MKNLIILISMVFCSHCLFANEKLTKSKVERVTIFTQGAQVFRTSNISVGAGITHLVFSGLTTGINPSSIQAGGKGSFVVTDVKHRIKYPEPVQAAAVPKAITTQIEQMEDSLTELGFRKEELQDRLNSLQLEKDMIVKNKLAKGEGKSDSLEVLKQAMDFFHKRLGELNTMIGKTKRDQYRNTESIQQVTQKLQELRAYKHDTEPEKPYQPDNQIVVTISADVPATGLVELSYMVSGAGWTPSYDLRASNTNEPVKLTYKANVYQSTGEDWNGVRIKLSTSNPNRSHIKPSLPVWYLSYYTAQRQTITGGARSQSTDNAGYITRDMEESYSNQLKSMTPAESSANFSQLIETMANVEFEIKLDYDIPSDGNAHMVAVKTESLPSTYTHYLVPKVESEAFLLARVTGWENLNLLPGNANLFYDGTYVGQTVINPNVINDTLDLAMGRDQAITVTRTRLKDKESNKLFGTEITRTIAYELRIKSNKGRSINLKVEDQIPVPGMKEIKVELKDSDKADFNPTTGSLTWDFKMDSKTYKSIKFSYEVTHNKDMPLSMF